MEILLICDIMNSKQHIHEEGWSKFPISIDSLNNELHECYKLPFKILSGDNFAAICKDLKSTIKVLLKVPEVISAYKMRMVVIQGNIQGLEKRDFSLLSGEVLWKSEEKFEHLRKKQKVGFYVDINLHNHTLSQLLNGYLNLILSHKMSWNETKRKIFFENSNGKTQTEVAERVGVKQQYVSKIINDPNFNLVDKLSKELIDTIEYLHKEEGNRDDRIY